MSWATLMASTLAAVIVQDGSLSSATDDASSIQAVCHQLGDPIVGSEPRSPDRLAAKGIAGMVLARLTIRGSGEVSNIEIMQLPKEYADMDGGPRFEKEVLRTVEKWRFPTFEGADQIKCDWLFNMQP